MSFIQVNLGSDVKERECAPEAEYDLIVSNFELREKEYENGKGHVLHIMLDIEGSEGRYKAVRHYLGIPREADDADTVARKQLEIKRFLTQFNVPHDNDGFDETALAGATATCKLTIEADETGEYEPQNRLRLNKLPAEA